MKVLILLELSTLLHRHLLGHVPVMLLLPFALTLSLLKLLLSHLLDSLLGLLEDLLDLKSQIHIQRATDLLQDSVATLPEPHEPLGPKPMDPHWQDHAEVAILHAA